ncbi:hypothetical protein EDD11_005736 [Mortierella claussenii]|nr:hypothetical protein EDD11_005736 [Mortierella claussenii]
MSVAEEDKKQRFRFTKQDEILLLQIVLRARPCPYKISSRDGAILVAWNNIADVFERESVRRPDGKLPHPRTCRTRCDKMIVDYLAMRASPYRKGKKEESADDRLKSELLERLANIQGKVVDPNAANSQEEAGPSGNGANAGTAGAAVTDVTNGDVSAAAAAAVAAVTAVGVSGGLGASGSSLVTPGHLLAHVPIAGASFQHRGSTASATGLTPQSLVTLSNSNNSNNNSSNNSNNGNRVGHSQSTSELLTASGLLLSTSGVPGVHSDHHHHNSPNPFLGTGSGVHSRAGRANALSTSSANSRKRTTNGSATSAVAALTTAASASSLNYLPRTSASSNSSTSHHLNLQRRSRAINKRRSIPLNSGALGTPYGQSSSGHHSNPSRAGGGLGFASSLSGQDLAGLSGLVPMEDSEEGNDDDNGEDDEDDGGFQDAREDFSNDYDHDFDAAGDMSGVDEHHDGHVDVSSLMPRTNSNNRGGEAPNKNARGKSVGDGGSGSSSFLSKMQARSGRFRRTSSNQGLQRHHSGKIGKFDLSLGGGLGSGLVLPSQLAPEDSNFLMRMLALEERRANNKFEEIEVDRGWLALEREYIEREMNSTNSNSNSNRL